MDDSEQSPVLPGGVEESGVGSAVAKRVEPGENRMLGSLPNG